MALVCCAIPRPPACCVPAQRLMPSEQSCNRERRDRLPPVPAFYDRPASLDDIVNHTVGRVLDLFEIDAGLVRRWTGRPPAAAHTQIKEGADL
jgi:hypothetical protein